MGISRVRMFAGPNGSGKTELIKRLQESDLALGPVVNADNIYTKLQQSGFIDLTDYSLKNIDQKQWDSALTEIDELATRVKKSGEVLQIAVREDMLINEASNLDAYTAALIADFVRHKMVNHHKSFSFETVMSHPSKIDFLKLAKDKGYKTYLYFIATEDPSINISRVKNRVYKGGHDVPVEKIKSRYYRSLDLLYEALKTVDRAYILDSSKRRSSVIFEKKNDGKGYAKVDNYPLWFEEAVIKKLG